MRFIDLTGRVFGRLTVHKEAEKSKGGASRWVCLCECGGGTTALGSNLTRGTIVSCGCWRKERMTQYATTHDMARTVEYHTWKKMIRRCHSPQVTGYANYGGRGISVCDRWRFGDTATGETGFECFFADMGHRPTPTHTIDRKENAGNYEPGNCRWATKREQAQNTRSNHYVEWQGERLALSEAARRAGVRIPQVRHLVKAHGMEFSAAVAYIKRMLGHAA